MKACKYNSPSPLKIILETILECKNLCKIHWSVVFSEKFIVSPADHRLEKLHLLNGM